MKMKTFTRKINNYYRDRKIDLGGAGWGLGGVWGEVVELFIR